MKTIIYGASDDLIEIDGAVSEEVNKIDAKNIPIVCSDGTKAKITYNGTWDIEVIEAGKLYNIVERGSEEETPHKNDDCKDVPGYSDALILDAGIEWVKIGRKTFRAAGV